MTSSRNFLVTVLVVWCWAFDLRPLILRWQRSIFRWASHQPREPFCLRGLGSLPSAEFVLHLVGCLWVLVFLSVRVGAHGIDAGVHSAGSAVVILRDWLGCSPEFEAEAPVSVLLLDVGLMIDALGECAVQLARPESGELNPALPVVSDLGNSAGGPERARAS